MGDALSAFTDRLVSSSSKDLRLRVTIDGVPLTFEAANNLVDPATFGFLDGRGMLVSVDESRTILDRQERRQVGGGATVVVQDRAGILRALFAQRSFRTTFVKATISASDSVVLVDDVTLLPASGFIYVAGETIQYTSKTAPSTLNGCTRGALGSPAQRHQGDADTGAGVYLVPPSWLGRRVRLRGYFNDDDGVADLSTFDTLGSFRLERAPQDLGEGRWELQCSHLSDELAKRKLGTGIVEVDTRMSPSFNLLISTFDGVSELLKFNVPAGTARLFSQGLSPSYALITFSGGATGRGLFSIKSATPNLTPGAFADDIELYAYDRAFSSLGRANLYGLNEAISAPIYVDSMKHVAILEDDDASASMRKALISRLGDGAQSLADDRLPGVVSTALGGPGFMFGAGIDLAEIDVASLASAGGPTTWSWVIDEELPLGDLLRDYCRQTNTAAVFTAAGQLRFAPLLEQRQAATAAIIETDIKGKITSAIDDGAIFSRVRLRCNYDPMDADYEATVDIIDEEIAATYAPAEGSIEIESRAIVIEPIDIVGGSLVRDSVTVQEIQNGLRRTMLDSRGGSLLLTFRVSAKHLAVQLGDLVTLALPSVSDFRGGDLGTAKGRVVERQPDWQTLDVDLTVLIEESLSHFAPGLVIATAVDLGATGWRLTATTTDIGSSVVAATLLSVRDGDLFRVYDPANNVSIGSGLVVVGVSSTTFDVKDIGPTTSLPLAAGLVLLLMRATTAQAADTFTGLDYAYFGRQPVLQITTRWR